MKNKIIIGIIAFLCLIGSAFAAPAISITGSNLNQQLQAGSNNQILVNFTSQATIPVPVVFDLNLTRNSNISSEFIVKNATLNGNQLDWIVVTQGNKRIWYFMDNLIHIMSTNQSSSGYYIQPKSSNILNITLFVHPATEPENANLSFGVEADTILIDVDRQFQNLPGSTDIKYIYVTQPVNHTVREVVETVRKEIPREFNDSFNQLNGEVKELLGQLQDLDNANGALIDKNKSLDKTNKVLIVLSLASLGGLGGMGYYIYRHIINKNKAVKEIINRGRNHV